MKKLVSYVLLLATMLNIFVVSASASTESTVETFYFGGEQYTLERTVTDECSQGILKDSKGKIVADYTYNSATGDLVDNLSGTLIPRITNVVNTSTTPYATNGSDYRYLQTDVYDFSLHQFTVIGLTAAMGAIMGGPVGSGVGAALGSAIAANMSTVYLTVDTYTRGDKDYFYIKRVGTLTDENNNVLYGPWETVERKRQK